MRSQPAKAWHALDESKSKYFLVDVISTLPQKYKVQFNSSKFQVPAIHILPYEVNKPSKLLQLRHVSYPEILDWIMQNGGQSSWVKLNNRVVLDLDRDTAEKRFEHVRYLMGRFLVSFRKKQYFYVSNDKISQTNCHTIHQMIIQIISKTTNLWPYAVSLDSVGAIYNICFSGLPIKFKTLIKQSEIIQMSIIPFKSDSKDLFVVDSDNNSHFFKFKSQIFAILQNSTRQSKRYFRIPDKNSDSKKHCYNVEYLVDKFLQIGFKIQEINHLIEYFSIILNLNQLQLVNVKKGSDYLYKIKERSTIKQNLNSLIGQELVILLQKQLNKYSQNRDQLQDIKIKLEIIMNEIFQFGIEHIAFLLNSKMINANSNYDNQVREFVYVQFPGVGQHFQESPQNYLITSINQFIKNVALKIPNNHPIQWYSSLQNNHVKIKQLYGYDINKAILNYLHKKMSWSQYLKNGDFLIQFKKNRQKKQQFDQRSRQYKISTLFQEIEQLRNEDDSNFINFLIRSQQTNDNYPKKQIVNLIKESIQLKKMELQQLGHSNRAKSDQQQFVQLQAKTFSQRYQYCQMTKSISRLKLQIFDGLEIYFKKNKQAGRISQINDNQIVLLSIPTFNGLQKQRNTIQLKSNKIKRQFKRYMYRKRFLKGVHQTYIKILFFKWLRDKHYILIKQSIKQTRIRSSIIKMSNVLSSDISRIQKYSYKQIKKRCSLQKFKGANQSIKPKTVEGFQLEFFKDLQEIKKRKRRQEGLWKLTDIVNPQLQLYYNQLVDGIHFQNKNKKIENGVQKLQLFQKKIILKSIQASYQTIKNQPKHVPTKQQHLKAQQSNNKHISPSPQSSLIIENSPTNSAQQMPVIYINEPISQNPVNESSHDQGTMKSSLTDKVKKNVVPIKEQQNPSEFHNGDNTDRISNAPSSVGFQKSQSSRPITKQQLYSIKDNPKFSFETWTKESIGFLKRKPIQPQDTSVVKLLFNKPQQQRSPNTQPEDEQNVDILIKEKIVVNPFFPYLIEHINNESQQNLQKKMSHQSSLLNQALLKKFPYQSYPKFFQETFNNILKIGKDKNTSKSKLQLIKQILKPITQSLTKESKNVRSVFDNELPLVIDYSWNHNIIKDELFLQFIKQIMMNQKEESLKELISVLQIITRYYYPSIQFIYSFLHYLKSLQSKNIQKLNQCFINTLMFAQAYQRYKGNNVTVLKDEILPKEKQSYNRLMLRKTQIIQQQLDEVRKITLRLFNQQKFIYKVRNQNLSHFKRKLLKTIKMIHYQDSFGIYIMRKQGTAMILFNEQIKGIDFVNEYQQSLTQNILYVRLKVYFPFNLKEINKTRILYLNSLIEQKHLPWVKQNYQNVVALAMLFDQFQQYRISNYLLISHQTNNQNVDISPIQNKYSQLVAKPGQKVCELQYFRLLKQNDFIAAKAYQVRDNILSPLGLITKLVIKPLELAFYEDNELKSSLNLKRIKSYFLDKGTIGLDLECPDEESHLGLKLLTIQGVQRVNELYMDLTTYINYLSQK